MKIGQVRMAPRTPVKERFAKLMFDTDWGPLIVWGMTVLAFFATLVLSPLLPYVGIVIAGVVLVAVVVATLLAVAAFFNALRRRMWMRAFGQFLLGIIAVPVFVVGFLFSAFASAIVAGAVACAVDAVFPDRASVKDDSGSLGFKVEFKRAHPFLAEYHRAIRFPSGKRIGIGMDTGGAGPFAVYRLESGAYYLVDGLDFDANRDHYRVNVSNETVEIKVKNGTKWAMIPNGATAVVGASVWNDSTQHEEISVATRKGEISVPASTPIGDSLTSRTYLGLACPGGRFEKGTGDPYAEKLDKDLEGTSPPEIMPPGNVAPLQPGEGE